MGEEACRGRGGGVERGEGRNKFKRRYICRDGRKEEEGGD